MQYFEDTGFWIARLSRSDQWHTQAVAISGSFQPSDRFFTSDFVLLELLNYFSTAGSLLRLKSSTIVEEIENDPHHRILSTSSEHFREARKMYERHSDKAWSLTDCSSFQLMRELGIQNALTFDHHFEQAGFRTIPGI